jgi:iron complex transport system substrate-binding protein
MTTVAARPQPSFSRLIGLVTVLAVFFAGFAMLAPQADAAKRQRVVAISPFAAATMVKLGMKPIAVGQTLGGDRRKPKQLNGIPVLKLSHPNGPNLERLAQIRPTIVFTSSRWAKGTSAMRQLGIRVVNADPTTVGGVYKSVTLMGRVLRRQKQANALKRRMNSQIRFATRNFKSRPKVMLILGVGRTPFTFLKNSWGGEIVSKAGGILVTGGASGQGGFARISDEVVVAENPDVIIAVPHGSVTDISEVSDYILNNEAWQTTNAFKSKRVFVSVDNELLQAGTDVGPVIQKVRRQFLKNW